MVSNSGTMSSASESSSPGTSRPASLQQHRHLQHVADRLALRDHVVADDRRRRTVDGRRPPCRTMASSLMRLSRCSSTYGLTSGRGVPARVRSSVDALGLVEREVVGAHAGRSEAARRPLVRALRCSGAGRACRGGSRTARNGLPHAARHARRRALPAPCERSDASTTARSTTSSSGVGVRRQDAMGRRPGHAAERTCSAVAARRAYMPRSARRYGSSARNGESSPDASASCQQLGGRRDEPRRHRQLDATVDAARAGGGASAIVACRSTAILQHVGGDERVAVAVAADPRAHAHHGRQRATACPRQRGELALHVAAAARGTSSNSVSS